MVLVVSETKVQLVLAVAAGEAVEEEREQVIASCGVRVVSSLCGARDVATQKSPE